MTTQNQDHIQSLDGLRGFAAFWVFLVHIMYAGLMFKQFPLNGSHNLGAFGVSLFFVLSGFLIGYLYLDRSFDRKALSGYLVSRFSRIAPAYLFIVLTAYLIVHFVDPKYIYHISTPFEFIRHMLFFGNANALWSIAPEVQFYLYFVLIWYAYQRRVTSNLWVWVLFITIALMIVGYIPKGTLLSTHVQLFTFGVVAGRFRRIFKVKADKVLTILQIISLVTALAYCAYLAINYNYYKPYHVIDYAALVALSVFTLSFSTRFTQLTFETAAMRFLGKVSFSLYLLNPITVYYAERLTQQYPDFHYGILIILFFSTILLSGLMFKCVEMPAQKWIKQTFQNLSATYRRKISTSVAQ